MKTFYFAVLRKNWGRVTNMLKERTSVSQVESGERNSIHTPKLMLEKRAGTMCMVWQQMSMAAPAHSPFVIFL